MIEQQAAIKYWMIFSGGREDQHNKQLSGVFEDRGQAEDALKALLPEYPNARIWHWEPD